MTRSKTAVTIASVAIVAAVFACGKDVASNDSAGPEGTTPAPDGGVCCPLTAYPCSGGYRGGWAANDGDCVRDNTFDGRWSKYVDNHGCELFTTGSGPEGSVLVPDGGVCCGCPTMPNVDAGDSGDAGGEDAPTDAADAG